MYVQGVCGVLIRSESYASPVTVDLTASHHEPTKQQDT